MYPHLVGRLGWGPLCLWNRTWKSLVGQTTPDALNCILDDKEPCPWAHGFHKLYILTQYKIKGFIQDLMEVHWSQIWPSGCLWRGWAFYLTKNYKINPSSVTAENQFSHRSPSNNFRIADVTCHSVFLCSIGRIRHSRIGKTSPYYPSPPLHPQSLWVKWILY